MLALTYKIGDGSVLNKGAEITATNFEYGNIQVNNGFDISI